MNEYYNCILQSNGSASEKFTTKWRDYILSLKESYNNAIQLRIGSHLRPYLAFWGYAFGDKNKLPSYDESIIDLAICIELLHKTSVIIDDYIDEDIARHNKLAFHKQYSTDETIIFSFYLISNIFEKVNTLKFSNESQKNKIISIFSDTLKKMSDGCLDELTLNNYTRYDSSFIKTIIEHETSTLIKNSLLLGYLYNNGTDEKVIKLIAEIGCEIGNLFQILNDLEPFCSRKNIDSYKGTYNIDFNKSKKNVVITYIYGMSKLKEQKRLEQVGVNQEAVDYLIKLYEKYDIYQHLMDDINRTQMNIEQQIVELKSLNINPKCVEGFMIFYREILDIAKSRLIDKDSA